MSLQHIPRCVWWPLGALISALTIFLMVFTGMLVRAKQVEIQLAQVSIFVEYANQLAEISDTLQATVSQLGTQDKVPVSSVIDQQKDSKNASVKQQSYYSANASSLPISTELILKEKKQQLEIISHGLQQLKWQLKLSNKS